MAAARRLKRVVASQPGFVSLKGSSDPQDVVSSRRKRVNKNKKKNWKKHSNINDVESFLEDVRLQERTTGWVRCRVDICVVSFQVNISKIMMLMLFPSLQPPFCLSFDLHICTVEYGIKWKMCNMLTMTSIPCFLVVCWLKSQMTVYSFWMLDNHRKKSRGVNMFNSLNYSLV